LDESADVEAGLPVGAFHVPPDHGEQFTKNGCICWQANEAFLRSRSPRDRTAEPPMIGPPSPKQIALRWVEAYNHHDPDAAVALYHEQVTNVQLPWERPVEGREAMRATYLKVFQALPDIRVDVDQLLEAGQWVVVEWRFSGTMQGEFAGHPPTHKPFTMRGCELFQIADGKICVQHGYWDKATLFSQLKIA
jgi:steroid delta-isomerase-like uncharacterized protein